MKIFYNFLLKLTLLLLLTGFYTNAAFSATYYVSNAGSDSNSGLSETSPWKTISKVNGKTFLPGDIILLKCGDIFNENLTISSSGSDANKILVSSYGAGEKPEIRGYDEISGWNNAANWVLDSNGIYRWATDLSGIRRLWINGDEKKESQTTALSSEYPWKATTGYFYVKAPSNPASYFSSIIDGSEIYNVLNFDGLSNVTVRGIKVTGGTNTVLIRNTRNITIENCEIGYRSKGHAFSIYSYSNGTTDNTIIRNNIINSGDSLYFDYYRNVHSTDDAIKLGAGSINTQIYNNYMWGWSHAGVEMINLDSSYPYFNNEIYNNYITAPLIDYSRGIVVDFTTNGYGNSVHHNTIVNTSVQNQFNGNGLKVFENIIDNVKGCPYPEKVGVGNGIAMDGYATPAINMEINNNTIRNCNYTGIRIYGDANSTIERSKNNIHDNNIFNNGTTYTYQIIVFASPAIHNNTFSNNHLYKTSSANVVSYLGNALNAYSFNTITTSVGDIKSGNDTILTYGNYKTNIRDLKIEYNETAVAKTVLLSQPMVDKNGTKYASSVTLQPYSSMVLMKDLGAAVAPGTPTSVVATAGNASATVTFAAPISNGGSAITGYTVTSIPAGGIDANAGSTSLNHSITGLTNGVSYTFTVKAINAGGTSVASAPSNSVIPKAPAVVTSYTFTGPTSGSVNSASGIFTVTPNNFYNGTITITPTGTASSGLTTKVLTFSNSATAQTFTITPTVAGNITLTATNNSGLTNPASLNYIVNAVTPLAPTSVVATAGNASATVTFAAPISNGGSAITGYTVTSIPAGGIDANAGSTSLNHSITGLTNGVSYTFTVKATNSIGTSVASAPSNSVIPKAPAVVTSYTFTGPTSGSVNSASASFTVTPNNLYTGTITITPSGTGSTGMSAKVLTFSNSATAQTFTITPTVAGNITLTATNNSGLTNPASLYYIATSTSTAPMAPTSVVATAGNSRASVTFAAPTNNGGSAITGYTVTSIPAGGIDANTGSTSLNHSITGLTNGVSYTFTVKATNSIGTSVASTPSNSVVPKGRNKNSRYLKNGELSDVINESDVIIEDVMLDIDVFPNPSKGKITVRFSTLPEDGSSINILDISGRKVASKLITGTSEEFSLDDQPAGIYFVNLLIGTNRTIHKIVITK